MAGSSRLLVLGMAMALGACADGASGAPNGPIVPISDDAGVLCAHATEGCACPEGASAFDCYLEPRHLPDGRIECTAGTRYCRDGAWTACESLESYLLRGRATALIDGPSACNACDPSCAVSRDIPGPGDLTGENSSGVEYTPTPGGVTIEGGGFSVSDLPDADMDGVPDEWDLFPGDPSRDGFTEEGGIFHVIAYGDTAGPNGLTFSTTLQTADIYFLIDKTNSMQEEIDNLAAGLTSGSYRAGCTGGVIGAIQCIIPDAWIGVGWFGEYPVYPYGDSNDVVYHNVQSLTSSVSAAQSAINGITTNGNYSWMESLTQALYSTVTGDGLGGYLAPRTGCAAGRWGYGCFRPETIPIVIVITDAPAHNGPNDEYDYAPSLFNSYSLPSSRPYVSSNETFASAHNLGDVTGRWVGRTGSTSSRANSYSFSCNASSRDATFRFSLTSRQMTTITLEGSSYDTVLGVFPTSGGGWCNDQAIGNLSRLVLDLPAGDYYVIVDGYYSSGAYSLSVGDPCAVMSCFRPPTYAETIAAVRDRGVRVMGIDSSEGYMDCRENLEDIATASNAVNDLGQPFVISINDDGSGLSGAVVDAVEELANYSRMDITARARDNLATPGIDERAFVDTLIAASFPTGRCDGIAADGVTFRQCLPGTNVEFQATFRNDVVMPTTEPQVFDFTIEIIGDGSFVVDSVPVRIIVPPNRATFEPSGTYWRDYDATEHCVATERPDWGALDWSVTTPPGTSVRFELRTSDDPATLDAATPVTFTVPSTTPTIDIAERLIAGGARNFLPYLQVRTVLLANAERTEAPVVSRFEVTYTCVPIE